MRNVSGIKIGFVEHESYFSSFATPSMVSTARSTGADVVLLLAEGATEDDMTDDELLGFLKELGLTARSGGENEMVVEEG